MEEPLRAFIALWPDEKTRGKIYKVSKQIEHLQPNGKFRLTPANKLHMTLAFLGGISQEDRGKILRMLRTGSFPGSRFVLDRMGVFPKSGILWLGETDSSLSALAGLVRKELANIGIGYDKTPFRAHVTLARNWRLPAPVIKFKTIVWDYGAPCLVLSIPDGRGRRNYLRIKSE
ncbi:RNA 2',3'-cyclic phosphodiesterase [Mesosutterella sp. OilRF-GAM-744-9]|uniref:RNA 2',3'-cyclic phosphodiesterase n=1 Tax=Mesosutterella porci TaxID=2915351 RepID=A0ABS9MTM9_9BURK|nr:RNA 2',3'-cyclic phosphodiesterase [Mesosutterella sp. oilRF-744-WT-GAM-9]MCG5031977.1 RNA 2',3'-cyclic phosphodiesterase [Mesosutterella sp. oilRF-744-WT-GAM-9]